MLFEGLREELFSEVLDLDRVRTVRDRGTSMNRLLWQLGEHGPRRADPDYRGSALVVASGRRP